MKKFLAILAACLVLFAGCGREEGRDMAGGESAALQQGGSGWQSGTVHQDGSSHQSGTVHQDGSSYQSGTVHQDGSSHQDGPAQQSGTSGSRASGAEKPEVLARREQILDITQEDDLFDISGNILKMQLFRGEPVLLWMKQYGNYIYQGTPGTGEEKKIRDSVNPDGGLYLYRTDGSRERMIPGEALSRTFEEMDRMERGSLLEYPLSNWYLDEEGCLYYATRERMSDNPEQFFLKVDASGELVFLCTLEEGVYVSDFLCLEGGRMYAVLVDSNAQKGDPPERVVEFDPDTGEFSGKDTFALPYERRMDIAAYGEGEDGGLYLYGYQGIQKVDLEDGSLSDVMSFAGSTYSRMDTREMRIHDFWIKADGSAELLYFSSKKGSEKPAGGVRESIFLEGSSKTPVVLRTLEASDWLKSQAAAFNSVSPSWRVVVEELASSGAADAEEYARQTGIEITAGKGPDILCGDLCGGQFADLAGKGALLDLGPYLEGAGFTEEDILPAAFGGWRGMESWHSTENWHSTESWHSTEDRHSAESWHSIEDGYILAGGLSGIYGVSPVIYPYGYKIRSEVLEGVRGASGPEEIEGVRGVSGPEGINALLDALEAWGEDSVYYAFADAGQVLELLLEGSESLWGMVDWEAGSCDFGGELFGRLLKAAERFAYDPRHRRPNLVQYRRYDSLLKFDTLSELEAEGMAPAGVLWDGGCGGVADMRRMLAVNAGSERKEGAWEFLRFLLGEEAQLAAEGSVPVNRAVLKDWAEAQMEEALARLEETNAPSGEGEKRIRLGDTYVDAGEMVSVEKIFTERELTQERVEEYLEALEKVRPLPVRAEPVLEIVLGEAGSYFGGDKGIPEVAAVIENRVQLYLDENR